MSEKFCPLTGVEINSNRQRDTTFYILEFAGNTVNVLWCSDCLRKAEKNNKIDFHHVVEGLIANNKLPENIFLHKSDCNLSGISDKYEKLIFPDFLETIPYPKTASQKMDNLLLYLYNKQSFDGQHLAIKESEKDFYVLVNYFRNKEELIFYIKSLTIKGYIESRFTSSEINFNLTHEGLNKVLEIEEKGIDSKSCFIAMAFNEKTVEIRGAIKKALRNTGYENPIIIDERHLESDKTIPEAIFNEIRKAKFIIADFTLHRNGVYFESGYALGLGKQIIYTCKKDNFNKAHFDIKQLQLVLYDTPEELEKKLVDKIEFWIK